MIHRVDINTLQKMEFLDITDRVKDIIEASGVVNGTCHIFVPHTTAAVMINEHADPSVALDIGAQLEAMAPQHPNYRHMEGNAPAHIKASIVGDSRTIFIGDGRLLLGTWQGIFFCEFDGPRNRHFLVKVVPD